MTFGHGYELRPARLDVCTAPQRLVDDIIERMLHYVFTHESLPAPKLLLRFENAAQVQFMIGHRLCRKAVLLNMQCHGIANQISFRGNSRWVAMVIRRFDIGNFMFDVPDHIDLHITLGWMDLTMSAIALEEFKQGMERQLRKTWRVKGKNPWKFGVLCYGTDAPNCWNFHAGSPALSRLQDLLNVIRSHDRKAVSSTTDNNAHERNLHLSAYDRRSPDMWLR